MTLRLPYRAFHHVKIASQLAPSGAPTIRYRPVIPIRIFTSQSQLGVFVGDAFADPGSDFTVFRRDVAAALGVSAFVYQMKHRWQGVEYPVQFARVQLVVTDGTNRLSWPTAVGFSDASIPYRCLLGLSGFFEFFDVRFLGSHQALEIEPNDVFRQVGGTT